MYSSNLGALRFFLSFWVFLAHIIPWWSFYNNETTVLSQLSNTVTFLQPKGSLHPAVVGFIVLSGYVIARNFSEATTNTSVFSWGIRRFFRIFPIYFVGIITGLLVFRLGGWNQSTNILLGTYEINARCVLLKILVISPLNTTEYPNCAFQGNAPLVTAAAEIVLYFFYGLVLLAGFLRRFGALRFMTAIALIWLISNLILMFLGWLDGTLLEYWTHASPFNYLLPWWLGATLALTSADTRSRSEFLKCIKFTLAFSSLSIIPLSSNEVFNEVFVRQTTFIIYSTLFTLLIHALVRCRQIPQRYGKVEAVSYSLYALHAPVSVLLIIHGFNLINLVILNITISLLSYKLIEAPFRKFGNSLAGNHK